MSSTVLDNEARTLKTLMKVADPSVSVIRVSASRPLLRKVFLIESRIERMDELAGEPQIRAGEQLVDPVPAEASPSHRVGAHRFRRADAQAGEERKERSQHRQDQPDDDLDQDRLRRDLHRRQVEVEHRRPAIWLSARAPTCQAGWRSAMPEFHRK